MTTTRLRNRNRSNGHAFFRSSLLFALVLTALISPVPTYAANPNRSGDQITLEYLEFSGIRDDCAATTSLDARNNVIHVQVLERGVTPRLLGEDDGMALRYTSATNMFDPALLAAPMLAADGSVYKTNFRDTVNQGAYDSFYPPVVPPLSIPADTGLPMPDVERLFLGDRLLAADQQIMPGVSDPYLVNLPQQFHQFVVDQPLFLNFPFGYTASDVRWFEAAGIPIAAYDDAGRENFYPLVRVYAEESDGEVVASVDTVVPISGEANCQECHASELDGGNGSAVQTLIDNDIEFASDTSTRSSPAVTLHLTWINIECEQGVTIFSG